MRAPYFRKLPHASMRGRTIRARSAKVRSPQVRVSRLVLEFSVMSSCGSEEEGLLEGSWVVRSGVISPLIGVIVTVTLLITPLITTHESPSRERIQECATIALKTQSLNSPDPETETVART